MKPKKQKQAEALVRRRGDVKRWMEVAVCSDSEKERDFANRKLFLAQQDVRRLEAKVPYA